MDEKSTDYIENFEYHSWFELASNFAQGLTNETHDLNKPHLRKSLENRYLAILVLYGTLSVFGLIFNLLEIYAIWRNKMYQDTTYTYLVNLAITDIIKSVFVIPLSQMSLLVQNWIFGEFLCYFLPMLQDIPAHVTVLTIFFVVLDRHMFLRNPTKPRLPGFIFITGTWLAATCIALPYPIYTTYLDLAVHGNVSEGEGAGICLFSVEKDLKDYARGIFIGMFVIPLGITSILFLKIFQTLDEDDGSFTVEGSTIHLRASYRRYYNMYRFNRGIFAYNDDSVEKDSPESCNANGFENEFSGQYEIDAKTEETRVQKHLISIVIAYALCFGPLNILSKVIHLETHETYEDSNYWDEVFALFVWIGFVPTVVNPIIAISLITNSDDKTRIQNYFRKKPKIKAAKADDGNNGINVAYITRPSTSGIISASGEIYEETSLSSNPNEQQ